MTQRDYTIISIFALYLRFLTDADGWIHFQFLARPSEKGVPSPQYASRSLPLCTRANPARNFKKWSTRCGIATRILSRRLLLYSDKS